MGRSPSIFNMGDTGSSQHGVSEFMGESSVVKKRLLQYQVMVLLMTFS